MIVIECETLKLFELYSITIRRVGPLPTAILYKALVRTHGPIQAIREATGHYGVYEIADLPEVLSKELEGG